MAKDHLGRLDNYRELEIKEYLKDHLFIEIHEELEYSGKYIKVKLYLGDEVISEDRMQYDDYN